MGPTTVVVVDEVVVVSSVVVGAKVVTIGVGNVVEVAPDVEVDVDVVTMAVLESFPPSASVNIKPTISMMTKALAPIMTS